MGWCVGGKAELAGSTELEDEAPGEEREDGRGCGGWGAVYISMVL